MCVNEHVAVSHGLCDIVSGVYHDEIRPCISDTSRYANVRWRLHSVFKQHAQAQAAVVVSSPLYCHPFCLFHSLVGSYSYYCIQSILAQRMEWVRSRGALTRGPGQYHLEMVKAGRLTITQMSRWTHWTTDVDWHVVPYTVIGIFLQRMSSVTP